MFRNFKWERIQADPIKPKYAIFNSIFAQKNEVFIEACNQANVNNTTRMASKWRNKKGSAYQFMALAKTVIAEGKKKK